MSTRSATGARFIDTPAAASSPAQPAAAVLSSLADQVPCVVASGIFVNPAPDRTWTLPPSWSVEMRSGALWPAAAAWAVRASTRARVAATPAEDRPDRKTPPTCRASREPSASALPVAGTPTMSSWPAICSMLHPATGSAPTSEERAVSGVARADDVAGGALEGVGDAAGVGMGLRGQASTAVAPAAAVATRAVAPMAARRDRREGGWADRETRLMPATIAAWRNYSQPSSWSRSSSMPK